ncbi:TAXI family TRAP transporter solute-binding subunit [Halococcus saccharolyticus]|uniref:TAXI family TRAP transporter solute-binding subunit n=1 Tax=Halococcus saccharolyticus TaxID=62319 RepID=UPI000AEB686F|nr:TAXI family TRAP transporter solute-binding subunit [Halococcus saccharolyticus]
MTMDQKSPDRRNLLKILGSVAGVGGLAGCLGDSGNSSGGSGGGNDSGGGGGGGNGSGGSSGNNSGSGNGSDGSGGGGETGMVMLTSTSTTSAYAMSQGIAATVNQNNNTVNVDARPSEGTNANVGQLQRQAAQIVYIQNWTANKLREGQDPFSDLSFTPNQVHHLYDLGWFLCTGNQGWETVADIESGSRVSPTPRGSGTSEMLQQALGYATEDYERVSIDYGSQGSAMSAGRLDVGAGTFVNFSVEPGWLQEMKGTVDLRLLDFPDNVASKLRQDPAINVTDIDTSQFDGFAYAPDQLTTPSLSYNFIARNDFSYDAVYSYLETLHANREGLEEYNALLGPLADEQQFLANPYDMPFHPAAADFYEEIGIWNDDLTRGEE